MAKQRLDALLVERGLCESRQQAQRLIRAGDVQVNHTVVDKPGTAFAADVELLVKVRSRFVSRGGEKLAKALAEFPIAILGRIALDGGISTGGFTDCLLQAGAKKVYGIDVGYGQVAWALRQDHRVVLRERTNLRHLTPEQLYGEPNGENSGEADGEDPSKAGPRPDLGVMDVSFISLTKVLPAFWALLVPPRETVLLVKPQFEVGRDRVGKKGVVRDPGDQADAMASVLAAAQTLGWAYRGLTWSPLLGPAGNIEYLLWLSEAGDSAEGPSLADLKALAIKARLELGD